MEKQFAVKGMPPHLAYGPFSITRDQRPCFIRRRR